MTGHPLKPHTGINTAQHFSNSITAVKDSKNNKTFSLWKKKLPVDTGATPEIY